MVSAAFNCYPGYNFIPRVRQIIPNSDTQIIFPALALKRKAGKMIANKESHSRYQ